MSDGINWGILQPLNQMAPIQTSAPSAGSAPMGGGSPVQMPGEGDPYAEQKMQMEQSRLGLLQNQDARAGELQQAELQQKDLEMQEKQKKIADLDRQAQNTKERQKIYQDVSAKGGSAAGLDAVQETLFKQGNVSAGLAMAKTREELQQKISSNDQKGYATIANGIYSTMIAAKPAEADPKTGQVIKPAVTPLDNYTKIYPVLKQQFPRLPDPKTFNGDNELYVDSLAHPVLDMAQAPLQADKAKQEELNKNAAYQNQSMIERYTSDLSRAISDHGASSKEAKVAADALRRATTDSERRARGGQEGSLDSLTNRILGNKTGVPSSEELIKQNTPEVPGMAPTAAPSVPEGRVVVKDAQGNVGHIPAAQLDEALKSGYIQVK